MPNDNPTPEEVKAFEAANPQLRPPPLGSEKSLLAGMVALLIGAVTGFVLWVTGYFSDKKNISILFFLMYASARAKTNYISFSTGSDSNPGTLAQPWQRDPNMIGWSGTASHSSTNDIHYFKAGDTWPAACFPMQILASGTNNPQNPEYYGTNGSWGTGFATFTGSHSRSNILIVASVTNIYCNGLHLTQTGGAAMADNSGNLVLFATSYFTFNNGLIDDWLTTATGSGSDTAHGGIIGGAGNNNYGFTNVLIENTEIDNAVNGPSGNWNGDCLRFVGTISNCIVHDNGSGVLFCQDFNHSQLYNINYPYSEYDPAYHVNGIYLDGCNWTSVIQTGVSGYIRNSIIHDIGTSMAYPNIEHFNEFIYNNLFYGVQTVGQEAVNIDINAASFNGVVSNCSIFNNTIVVYNAADPNGITIGARMTSSDGGMTYTGPSAGIITITNNMFIAASPSAPSNVPLGYTNHTSGTSYVGVASQLSGNNVAMTPTTATADGYTLGNLYAPTSASNPTVGTGGNLTSLGLFTTDINGTPRPSVGAWDVGAYEFAGGPVPGGVSISGGGQINISGGGQINIQ